MQLPAFLARIDGGSRGGTSTRRKLLALGLFPLLLCLLTGMFGSIFRSIHDQNVELAASGVRVMGTVSRLDARTSRRSGRNSTEYVLEYRYGLDPARQDQVGTRKVSELQFRSLTVGAAVPLVVSRRDPAIHAAPEEVERSLHESAADIWGQAFGFALCFSSLASILVAFARRSGRRARGSVP